MERSPRGFRRVARSLAAALARPLVGRRVAIPGELLARFPELDDARWRVGGLPPRLGGWFLGASSVAGITLWDTVFLAPSADMSAELLLHELGHVRQFAASRSFPLRYCWQSVRRGYVHNPFEFEAEAFARRLLAERSTPPAAGPAVHGRVGSDAPRQRAVAPAEGS